MSFELNRRRMLAGLGACAMPLSSAHAERASLTLYGAPIAVSLPVAHVVERRAIPSATSGLRFHKWRSPDEMRAGVASGEIEVTTAPAPAAANMYNKGLGMRLLAVLTSGMLYIMSSDPKIERFEDLTGRRVLVPFRGDMPDRVFSLLMRAHGMTTGDIEVEYTSTPIEAAQLLLAGRASVAILQEPAASAAMIKGAKSGVAVRRALDMQALYGAATSDAPDIPQAVLVVRDSLRARAPEFAGQLLKQIRASTNWVVANPSKAAELGAAHMGMPKPVLERAIPTSNLNVRSAGEARAALEGLYGLIAAENAAPIGGRMPDDGFYLDVDA